MYSFSFPHRSALPSLDLDRRMREITIKAGNSLHIHIPFTGTPKPVLRWKKEDGDEEITTKGRFRVDTSGGEADLTIRETEREDSGIYILEAENEFGVQKVSAKVKVVGKSDNICSKPHLYSSSSSCNQFLTYNVKLRGNCKKVKR